METSQLQAVDQAPSGTGQPVSLRRALTLPLLVFYGVGVTIGAGIFALIGEVLRVAGDQAPLAFILAGAIASASGVSYAILSSNYPRSGGEAIYVNLALGSSYAKFVGYGVTATAVISSAVIAQAFAGYLGTLIPVAETVLIISIVSLLALIACLGVRESVYFAALITILEVGTLVVVIFYGSKYLDDSSIYSKAISFSNDSSAAFSLTLSAAVIAFFAFIGFEDMVNMAEETINPRTVMPKAIIITLLLTIGIYAAIALIAIAIPNREYITSSNAPLAAIFESVSGKSGKTVSAMASIAMVNGILVQIVMASRVIYGMTREGLAPKALGVINTRRQTPLRAILLVSSMIVVLALWFPLVNLAKTTSLIILSVFVLVNLALWRLGETDNIAPVIRRWRYWGLIGAAVSFLLLASELIKLKI